MRHLHACSLLLLLSACQFNPKAEAPVKAAREFNELFATQRLHANAAGDDCLVLLVGTNAHLDDTAVESLHYGAGNPPAYKGGVRQFTEDRGFRAVVYRDTDRALWTYGAITRDEAQVIRTCR